MRKAVGALLLAITAAAIVWGITQPDGPRTEAPPAAEGLVVYDDVVTATQENATGVTSLVVLVTDTSQRPLQEARVFVVGRPGDASTDRRGTVFFDRLASGEVQVRVEKQYYQVAQADVALAAGTRTTVTIPLPVQEGLLEPPHAHDHFGGRASVVLVEDAAWAISCDAPCPVLVTRDRYAFPEGAAVWPGTGSLEVTATWEGASSWCFDVHAAGQHSGRPLCFDAPGQSASVAVAAGESDPPHVTRSRWYFEHTSGVGEVPPSGVRLTVVAHRSDEPQAVDPPHPDLWGQETQMRLDQRNVTYSYVAYDTGEGMQYQGLPLGRSAHPFRFPDGSVVLPGTATLRVEADVPQRGSVDVLFQYQPDDGRWYDAGPSQAGGDRLTWEVPVDPAAWDTPYATQSAWQWRLVPGGTGLFHGDFEVLLVIEKQA